MRKQSLILTGGKYLWTRTIGSTIVGEGIDTALFITIAFAGTLPGTTLFTAALSAYLFKVLYEIIATPITYQIVSRLKKIEGCDHFDYKTSFNPFRLRQNI